MEKKYTYFLTTVTFCNVLPLVKLCKVSLYHFLHLTKLKTIPELSEKVSMLHRTQCFKPIIFEFSLNEFSEEKIRDLNKQTSTLPHSHKETDNRQDL